MGLHLLAEIAQAHDDFTDTVSMQKRKLMVDEGLAGQFDKGFGDGLGNGPETRCKAAGQQSNRNFLDLQFTICDLQL